MNHPRRLLLLAAALPALLSGVALNAAGTSPKAGYTVVLEVSVNDKGTAEDAKVFKSEDQSGDHVLEQLAMEKTRAQKFEVRMKDGKPAPYTARVPYFFPIAGDEGADSNLAPRPHFTGKTEQQPVYPPALAAQGEPGSAIVEIIVGADGALKDVSVLRATRPEFAESATAAIKQWHFSPALQGGEPISSRCRLAVVFETEESQPTWEWRIPPRPSLGSYVVMHVLHPKPPAPAAATPATPPQAPAPAPGK